MFVGVYIIALLVFSAVGAVHFRAAPAESYAPFLYWCAVFFGVVPVVTGDWIWSIATVPASLVVARMMLARRARDAERATRPPAP